MDPELSDVQLCKKLQFSKFNLLRDFINLKTLFGKDFQIQSPGDEMGVELKYSGKGFCVG